MKKKGKDGRYKDEEYIQDLEAILWHLLYEAQSKCPGGIFNHILFALHCADSSVLIKEVISPETHFSQYLEKNVFADLRALAVSQMTILPGTTFARLSRSQKKAVASAEDNDGLPELFIKAMGKSFRVQFEGKLPPSEYEAYITAIRENIAFDEKWWSVVSAEEGSAPEFTRVLQGPNKIKIPESPAGGGDWRFLATV